MNPRESVRLATVSLRANKMRSALTLLGVIIGIASVIAIMTLGKAMQKQTLDSLEQFGIHDVHLEVKPRQEDDSEAARYMFQEIDDASKLTPDMIEDLRAELGTRAKGIAFELDSSTAQATRGLAHGTTMVSFVNADQLEMQNLPLTAGRFLTQDDIEANRAVAVVSPEVVEQLFNNDPDSAIGQEVELDIGGQYASVQVVGAYGHFEKQGVLVGDFSQSMMAVPYTVQPDMMRTPVPGVDNVSVRAADGADTDQVAKDVQAWADRAYEDDPDYKGKVADMKRDIDQLNQTLTMMSVVVSAIGGISLLVGGIGVMNIMLITVTERTREIGVRMALGATRRMIRTQFVTEAMIVCLIGGLFGVVVGAGFGMLGALLLNAFVFPPISAVLLSLVFALLIGLFFGYYPANRASRMNPIEALRYE
ncbi:MULTISPECIES: ABC transporter permease [Corynebacterium]|uniref:ABC transporter permease n=1 Tax=Corynebacterium TaxID=1716 RepID=UPI00210CA968|nr:MULTISPECIES: ABC transporter permease [Corynebacterium]UUA87645.1 ABC transporter permease [Corynebacterium pseudogenitalium]WPJ92244.1 ABC transporter permease [Corynebacterium sp. UMB2355A]